MNLEIRSKYRIHSKRGRKARIYFIEKGASQRPSKVVYDRSNSSMPRPQVMILIGIKYFDKAEWFHFTGITPALGVNSMILTKEACKAAKDKGLMISCDLNYRKNLWSPQKAGQIMGELMGYVDLCIANEEDAEKVFGKKRGLRYIGRQAKREGYKEVARKLIERFNFKKVAITLRESITASDNNWAAMLYDGNEYYFSKSYPVHIVDRVGGGDAFGGGLIYAILNLYNMQETIDFAVAASCLKHSIEGDFNHVSINEVRNLMNGDGSGRVQR
jgi:2-dehydro-3-deoxygluconokinase